MTDWICCFITLNPWTYVIAHCVFVIVLPPFWSTIWFCLMMFVLLILFISESR